MRFFLLPFLLFSFVFACDFPHEEVGGYKIGCPHEGNGTLKNEEGQDKNVQVFEEKLDGSFFEHVEISVLNGNIEGLIFRKTYTDVGDLVTDQLSTLSSLGDRWGDYEIFGSDTMQTYMFENPNSDVLNEVTVMSLFMPSISSINVIYESKKLNEYNTNKTGLEMKNRKKQLEGF